MWNRYSTHVHRVLGIGQLRVLFNVKSLHLVGLLDCHTNFTWPAAGPQVFTAGACALAGPTLALPLDIGCWGRTTQNPGWNDLVWGRHGRIDCKPIYQLILHAAGLRGFVPPTGYRKI